MVAPLPVRTTFAIGDKITCLVTNVPAPLAGNIFKVNVSAGQTVDSGDVIMILEAMKMETEVRSPEAGTVQAVLVKEGDAVQVGDVLLTLG